MSSTELTTTVWRTCCCIYLFPEEEMLHCWHSRTARVCSQYSSSVIQASDRYLSRLPSQKYCKAPPHTLEHWRDCSGTLQARMEIFGITTEPLLSFYSVNVSGPMGRTGKMYSVTA